MKNTLTSCVKRVTRRTKLDIVTESIQHLPLSRCLKVSSFITRPRIGPLSLAACWLVLFKAARHFVCLSAAPSAWALSSSLFEYLPLCFFRRIFGRCWRRGRITSTDCCQRTNRSPAPQLSRTLTANVCSFPAFAQSWIPLESPDVNPDVLRWTCSVLWWRRANRYCKHSPGHSSPDPSCSFHNGAVNCHPLNMCVYSKRYLKYVVYADVEFYLSTILLNPHPSRQAFIWNKVTRTFNGKTNRFSP